MMHGIFRFDAEADQHEKVEAVQQAFGTIYKTHEQIARHEFGPDEDSILRYHLISSG
jgi:hypothetical protein